MTARSYVSDFLRTCGRRCVVRVNAASTAWHSDDVAMAVACGADVMLPKAQTPQDVTIAGASVLALIETALGVLNAFAIASVPGVARLAFGSLDLAAELGIDAADDHALYAARSALVLASGAAGLPPPIDGVTVSVRDDGQLTADVHNARRLGFGGKLCIHPAQVDLVNAGFRPSAEELAWAHDVLAASTGSVVVLNGRMIDAPVVKRARRIVELHSEGGNILVCDVENP
jgi:citrate lyase subunit beta/citryl-CoA lyase